MSSLDSLLIWLNSGVCSQDPSHSFWVGGRPLPLCARDVGLFGAFLLALPVARQCPATRQFWWLLGLLPLALDGLNSAAAGVDWGTLYQPSNAVRLATGLLAGACLALAIRPQMSCEAALLAALPLPAISPHLALSVAATIAVASLLATANLLARPLNTQVAWLLAIPELATLALLKQGALALLR